MKSNLFNKSYIISQLKKGKACIKDIPDEYRNDTDIIAAERKLGLRKLFRCGYDVINDHFFVEEDLLCGDDESGWAQSPPVYFDDFDSYFNYLEGNIYENSCYFLLDSRRVPDFIDKGRLYKKSSFVECTISEYTISMTDEELAQYNAGEKRKKQVRKWIEKFNKCSTSQQLSKMVQNYRRSALSSVIDVSFFFWLFIFENTNDETRFTTIMEYVSSGIYPSYKISNALCAIYHPDSVVENYKYELGTYQTCRKHIRAIKHIAENVKEERYNYTRQGFFDNNTHFFYVETKAFEPDCQWPTFSYRQYFDEITDLITFLDGNLTHCDLSNAQKIQVDFSKCIVDDTTKLPINPNEEYDYSVRKEYDDCQFIVHQEWKRRNSNIVVKSYKHKFDYFFDFISFLHGDLTEADLVSCAGLDNITPTDKINLRGAWITSEISEKWGIPYNHFEVSAPSDALFELPMKNEAETALVLHSPRELIVNSNNGTDQSLMDYEPYSSLAKRIYYISDIHLTNLLKNKGVKCMPDAIKIIRDLVFTIARESNSDSLVLINGDTSLDYSIFELFVSELAKFHRTVIFTIGNHDIWSCPNETIDQLSERYRVLFKARNMYLLQNDILFFNDFEQPPEHISEQEINDLTEDELKNRIRTARLIIFGGTGFSGYNPSFNAATGLYRYNNTIGYSRDIEIKETQRFERLYKKIATAFHGKNTVIMTHMPLPDWCGQTEKCRGVWDCPKDQCERNEYKTNYRGDSIGTYSAYQPGFIYVSGHTHRNFYYDDGSIRIYADNQFGYNKNNPNAWPHLKYFEVDNEIDLFADYIDGIYTISAEEYRLFYRCKNMYMDFTRETNIIYMLKKSGYYCFIHKAKNSKLSILNGGALRNLDRKDINYYYNNMALVISALKEPLNKYTAYQKQISQEIKRFGGNGSIHGCIVDIDFYNHVYVNPFDGTMTGYWAGDIINKVIYPTIPALLEAQCPDQFARYKKMLSEEMKNNLPVISGQGGSALSIAPVAYLDTDIYKASRQIKKMQKLNSNILSIWPDNLPSHEILEE